MLHILPSKIEKILNDLSLGIRHRTKPNIFDRILSVLGELEKKGTKSFGNKIKVNNDCNGCGWCEKSCPRGNIELSSNSKPV
ncbi:MAG: 4Fe-4S binding protein [Bacillota bacterium]